MKRLYVDDKLHAKLKKIAVHEGRTMEWLVNAAIETYLTIPMRPLGPQTPRVTSIEPTIVYEDIPELPHA